MPIGAAVRYQDGTAHPDRLSAGGFGELQIGGGTAFASAVNPASEVIDGTGVNARRNFRVTLSAAAGTLAPIDPGDAYLVHLDLHDFSCGVASGNVQFTVEYAPDGVTFAAFGTTDATGGGGRMQAIRLALTTKESISISRVQKLSGTGLVRATVTSAAGDVITITEGALRISKWQDIDPPFIGR